MSLVVHALARRSEPRLVPLISKGTVDLRVLRPVGSDAADYVAPSDRYAVVPQASGQNGSVAVPQVRTRPFCH